MLQNVLITGLTPLCDTNEINRWDNRPFTTVWPDPKDRKQKDVTRTIKKKRVRTAFTIDQLRTLERTFSRNKYIDVMHRRKLANTLSIQEQCIKIWFQNRRMKEKRESSGSASDTSSEVLSNYTCSSPSPDTTVKSSDDKEGTSNIPETSQCELPRYPNYVTPNRMYPNLPYSMPVYNAFQNDNTVYPIQYYPTSGLDYNYPNYGQYNPNYNEPYNNWQASNFDLHYI